MALLVACDVSLGGELLEVKIRVWGVRFMEDQGLVEPETTRTEDVFEHEELVPVSATAAAALVRSGQDVNNETSHERSTVVGFLTEDIGNLYKLSGICGTSKQVCSRMVLHSSVTVARVGVPAATRKHANRNLFENCRMF